MKIKSWLPIVIVAIVLLAIAFLLFPSSSAQNTSTDDVNVNYNKLDEVVFDVKTEKVRKGNLSLYINTSGLIRAAEELEITSNINGVINTINVYEGKSVKKGDLLIGFDDREYEIALNETKVKVTDAKVEFGFLTKDYPVDSTVNPKAKEIEDQIAKLENDYKLGKIDEKKYNEKKDELDMKLIFTGAKREEVILNKSGLTSAINAYKRAKLNYEYTKVLAPFNGVVGDFNLVVGQRIAVGQKLLKLFDVSSLRVEVGVLESDVTKISVGKKARITIPSSEKEFLGNVVNVSPYIDPNTKTCKVVVKIDNPENILKPGMFANVLIETNTLKDRILIPKKALLVRDKRNLVFTVENNLAKWKYVEIGEQNDNFIEIKEGLKENEDVIVEGQYTLAHDAKVRVIN
ncbi:efflux RND transporter periplasmic adaptor subunit [Melioribacteraceae bacterium 4301-Me]|uniref:efflux RND transporter periplasmic adaptor subunit n=1 Tax=Pyranulibacter aquaticus TaxID=3163344 RepID=UPI0035981AB1